MKHCARVSPPLVWFQQRTLAACWGAIEDGLTIEKSTNRRVVIICSVWPGLRLKSVPTFAASTHCPLMFWLPVLVRFSASVPTGDPPGVANRIPAAGQSRKSVA
jgi:hypothetical protein